MSLPMRTPFTPDEAERVERALHRVALRVEHLALQPDVDGGLHRPA